MKTKKLLVMLALTLTASMAVGCGSTTSENTGDKGTDLSSSTITKYEASDMSQNPKAAANRGTDTLIIGSTEFDGCFNPLGYSSSAYDNQVNRALFDALMIPDEKGEMTEYRLAKL